MPPSILKAPQAAQTASEHFKQALDHFIQTITDTNSSIADDREAARDLWDACRDTGEQSAEGVKEALRERFAATGWTEDQINDWFEHKWEDVKDLADQIHETAPKAATMAKKAGKYLWAKVLAGVAIAGLFVVGFVAGHQTGQNAVDLSGSIADANQHAQEAAEMNRRMDQFSNFMTALQEPIPSVEAPQTGTATAPPTAVAELPRPVAAVAVQPVRVTLQAPNGFTQTVTSSVGQVWNSIPSSRSYIEKEAQNAQSEPYHYAFKDPNSCSARDCLSAHPQSHLHIHKDVQSPLEDGNGGHITAHLDTND
jgi:ABC-type multidrug transport system fused ATPase/permease subunit